jgi:hypothetical protein
MKIRTGFGMGGGIARRLSVAKAEKIKSARRAVAVGRRIDFMVSSLPMDQDEAENVPLRNPLGGFDSVIKLYALRAIQ